MSLKKYSVHVQGVQNKKHPYGQDYSESFNISAKNKSNAKRKVIRDVRSRNEKSFKFRTSVFGDE